jgi:hypothetical protein
MDGIRYQEDDATFSADAYTVAGYRGVAWRVLGWLMEADADTEWSGEYVRTDRVVAVMVGDDRRFVFERDAVTPLAREEYCGQCGQVGCRADAYSQVG